MRWWMIEVCLWTGWHGTPISYNFLCAKRTINGQSSWTQVHAWQVWGVIHAKPCMFETFQVWAADKLVVEIVLSKQGTHMFNVCIRPKWSHFGVLAQPWKLAWTDGCGFELESLQYNRAALLIIIIATCFDWMKATWHCEYTYVWWASDWPWDPGVTPFPLLWPSTSPCLAGFTVHHSVPTVFDILQGFGYSGFQFWGPGCLVYIPSDFAPDLAVSHSLRQSLSLALEYSFENLE